MRQIKPEQCGEADPAGIATEETERFIAFRSHWGFESEFCTPGEGHEKGGVEAENGYCRRNHLVPLPKVRSWEELNTFLLEESKRDEQRVIGKRSHSVGAGMCLEREHLLPLAEEGFQLAPIHFPTVNSSRCVRVLTNFYSAPAPVGCEVQVNVRLTCTRPKWRSGTRASALPVTIAVSAVRRRFAIWSIIWTC